jgi:hypothetical protein
MAQTSYSNSYSLGFEGMLADAKDPDIVSAKNAEASANLHFGRGVRDSANGALNLSATGQPFLGVAVFEQQEAALLTAAGEAVKPKDTFNVLRKGRIVVRAEVAVAIGDPVFVRHTVNGGTTAVGRFRNNADTARADQVTAARWVTSTSGADQLAVLEINLP